MTFIVVVSNIDSEVMGELSCVDVEILLIGFERNTLFDGRPKHHLRALPKVVHTVFKFRHIVGEVNSVEEHLMIRCDLDSLVALNEVDKTSDLDIVILLPRDSPCDFLLLLLEENDPAGASCDQCLVIE